MPVKAFTPIQLNLDKAKTVWVATVEVELSQMAGTRTIAIVMKASTFNSSSDIDYFITNIDPSIATELYEIVFLSSIASDRVDQ